MRDLPSPPVLTSPSQGEICDEIFPNYDDQLSQHSIEDQFSSNIAASQPARVLPSSDQVLARLAGNSLARSSGWTDCEEDCQVQGRDGDSRTKTPRHQDETDGQPARPANTRKLGAAARQTEYYLQLEHLHTTPPTDSQTEKITQSHCHTVHTWPVLEIPVIGPRPVP